jgi:GNAT superfamily N-acetyltransferase
MIPEIREAGVEDWELVREIRLRALADTPSTFASRLEEERDQLADMWRDRLSRSDAATFLIVDETGASGLVTVFLVPAHLSRAHLVSMWVAPERRRAGLGRALVERVTSWAANHGADTVELWVTDTNGPGPRALPVDGVRRDRGAAAVAVRSHAPRIAHDPSGRARSDQRDPVSTLISGWSPAHGRTRSYAAAARNTLRSS